MLFLGILGLSGSFVNLNIDNVNLTLLLFCTVLSIGALDIFVKKEIKSDTASL